MNIRLFVVILWIALTQCSDKKSSRIEIGPPVQPAKQLNAAFLIVDGVYNSELVAPMDVLQHTVFHTDRGIRVFTVAPSRDVVTTFEGLRITPDYSFLLDTLPEIDILIVPSTKHSMDEDLQNSQLINFIAKTGRDASYVMSLCDGAFLLAQAGLLDMHACTTFPGDVGRLRQAYPALHVHEGVTFVHDRKMITSAGGAKSYEPALYLVELLYGRKVADAIAGGLVINWDVASLQAVIVPR